MGSILKNPPFLRHFLHQNSLPVLAFQQKSEGKEARGYGTPRSLTFLIGTKARRSEVLESI